MDAASESDGGCAGGVGIDISEEDESAAAAAEATQPMLDTIHEQQQQQQQGTGTKQRLPGKRSNSCTKGLVLFFGLLSTVFSKDSYSADFTVSLINHIWCNLLVSDNEFEMSEVLRAQSTSPSPNKVSSWSLLRRNLSTRAGTTRSRASRQRKLKR